MLESSNIIINGIIKHARLGWTGAEKAEKYQGPRRQSV
jgi:hypothetical protein